MSLATGKSFCCFISLLGTHHGASLRRAASPHQRRRLGLSRRSKSAARAPRSSHLTKKLLPAFIFLLLWPLPLPEGSFVNRKPSQKKQDGSEDRGSAWAHTSQAATAEAGPGSLRVETNCPSGLTRLLLTKDGCCL